MCTQRDLKVVQLAEAYLAESVREHFHPQPCRSLMTREDEERYASASLDYLRATNATKLGTAPIGFMAPGAGGAPTFSTLPAKGAPTLQVSTCLPGN